MRALTTPLILLLFFAFLPAAHPAPPMPLMILDGESAGPYHDWQHTTPVLKKELDDSRLFQVDVVTAPKSNDLANFNPDLSRYRAIVMNYDAPDWPAALKAALEKYIMKSGGGLVIVHAADNSFPNWLAYNQMIGIGGWRDRNEKSGPSWFIQGGHLASDPSPGAAGSHGARIPFQITTQYPEHPIMKGLPKIWIHVGDELYAGLRGPGQNMTVLATAYSDPQNQGTGRNEPILIALSYGKGRIFHTTLGHDVAALHCIGFTTTFQRGTEWAATGRVTQKVPANFPTAEHISEW